MSRKCAATAYTDGIARERSGKTIGAAIIRQGGNMEQEEMTRQEQHDIVYRRCICEYGTQPQIDMCIEEMSELTKALLKYRRKFALARGENVNPTNGDTDLFKARADIIDELADVRIMCRQMELLFQAEDEVERRIDFKVDRQLKRLEG
jgi:hypothetical protein